MVTDRELLKVLWRPAPHDFKESTCFPMAVEDIVAQAASGSVELSWVQGLESRLSPPFTALYMKTCVLLHSKP